MTTVDSPATPSWSARPLRHSLILGFVGIMLILSGVALSAHPSSFILAILGLAAVAESIKFFIKGIWKRIRRP